MGDKPPPHLLGNIHPKYVRPPPGAGDRLESLNPSRDTNIGMPKATPMFKPNIVGRVKKEPTKGDDIDSKLKGPMASLLDESTFQQQRINARFRPVKPSGRGTDTKSTIPGMKSPFMGGTTASAIKKKDKGDDWGDMEVGGSSGVSKKHELEIDSSDPNHPSVLPFIDPQRQKELSILRAKDKAEDIIMNEIKQEIAMLDKEEEKATPDVLISALDVPTPLMIDGEFLNEDNLFFIQLPSALPFTPPPPPSTPAQDPNATNANTNNTTNTTAGASTNNTNATNAATAQARPPGARPPQRNEHVNALRGVNGHLGKIVVYKSGKVKLKVGDILYDITAANNPNFLEELMVLEGSSCYRVGPMSQHLIVTPDIEDLLQKVDKM